ncbi:hypothetical protein HC256_002589 [Beauveria bassiana]|nr:hypothetical protein HC256_002589 [Beauveria bassiana]
MQVQGSAVVEGVGLDACVAQHRLLLLVGAGGGLRAGNVLDDAQKQRHGVARQARANVRGQTAKRLGRGRRVGGKVDGDAAGAAVVMGQLDAVDVGLADGRVGADGVGDLVCRDVFRLPAKGVADAVVEGVAALGVEAHDVAGAVPGVAAGKDVAQNLGLAGFCVVEVALEEALEVGRVDAVDELARRAGFHAAAEAGGRVAVGRVGFVVVGEKGHVVAEEEAAQPAHAADGAGEEVVAAEVPRRAGTLGRGIELGNGGNTEALFELVPNVRTQAVADGDGDLVLLVEVLTGDGVALRRRGEQVAQRLADVLDAGGVVLADVLPEGLCGEFAAEGLRAARDDGGAKGEQGGGAVVQRHRRVHDVAAAAAEQHGAHGAAGDALGPRDDGGLGQARGAGRVDEDGHVGEFLLCAVAVGEADRGDAGGRRGDVGRPDDKLDARPEARAHLISDVVRDGGVQDALARRGGLDAVRERLARQVIVDEGGLGANGPEPPPQEQKRVRVLVVEGDNGAGLDAVMRAQVGAVAEDGVVKLGVRVAAVLEQQHVAVGVALAARPVLEGVEEREAVVAHAAHEPPHADEANLLHGQVVPQPGLGVEVGAGGDGGWCRDGKGHCGCEHVL